MGRGAFNRRARSGSSGVGFRRDDSCAAVRCVRPPAAARGHQRGGSGADRRPAARRFRHARADRRPRALRDRSGGPCQRRHRRRGAGAAQRRRARRVLLGPAVLHAEARGRRARHRVPRNRQPRPRPVAGPDERRAPARLRARALGSGRSVRADAGVRRRLSRLAVRRAAVAGADLRRAFGAGPRHRPRQLRRGRPRPPLHRLRRAVLRTRRGAGRRDAHVPHGHRRSRRGWCRATRGTSPRAAARWWRRAASSRACTRRSTRRRDRRSLGSDWRRFAISPPI